MKKKRGLYNTINFIAVIIVIYFLLVENKEKISINVPYFLYAIIPFICIHILRILRQYIIFIDNKMKLHKLTKAYLKSSLINTIVPFKIGELFKIYLYGYEMDNYKKSIIGVIIDKFFDAVILLLIFITIEIFYQKPLSFITILLLIFVGLIIIIYVSFENTYNFLNKFLIKNKNSETCIKCLKILEELKIIFSDIKNMIKDRIILILILTSMSWAFEIWFVSIISKVINNNSSFIDFINYMNNSFIGTPNILSKYYILITLIIFIAFIISYAVGKLFKES